MSADCRVCTLDVDAQTHRPVEDCTGCNYPADHHTYEPNRSDEVLVTLPWTDWLQIARHLTVYSRVETNPSLAALAVQTSFVILDATENRPVRTLLVGVRLVGPEVGIVFRILADKPVNW